MSNIINKEKLAEAPAWDVEKTLEKLSSDYSTKIENEMLEVAAAIWLNQDRKDKNALSLAVNKEALRMASSNRSTWSGGNSVKNMCEQIKRDVAMKWADGFVLRIPESCLNEEADKIRDRQEVARKAC